MMSLFIMLCYFVVNKDPVAIIFRPINQYALLDR